MASPLELTPKQEKFAQVFVEEGNASEAYRQAYDVGENTKPETIWTQASVILSDPKVSNRVVELQRLSAERCLVTIQSLTEELEEARVLAVGIEQPSAAVAASMGKAKLHGKLTDKQEMSGPNGGAIKIECNLTFTKASDR